MVCVRYMIHQTSQMVWMDQRVQTEREEAELNILFYLLKLSSVHYMYQTCRIIFTLYVYQTPSHQEDGVGLLSRVLGFSL